MRTTKKSNNKLAKKLASIPLEYQASVYAKEMKLRCQEKQAEQKGNLERIRNLLKSLEEKLQKTENEELRAILQKEIDIQKKIFKRAPRTKRKWSPILLGSFESKSR